MFFLFFVILQHSTLISIRFHSFIGECLVLNLVFLKTSTKLANFNFISKNISLNVPGIICTYPVSFALFQTKACVLAVRLAITGRNSPTEKK